MQRLVTAGLVMIVGLVALEGQARRPARPAAQPVKTEPAEVICPAALGTGARTGLEFCDVLSGRQPEEGVRIRLPSRTGPATLVFDLHNRHTYSEDEIRAGRAYARYTATVLVATLEGEVLSRAAVRSEFRTEADLFDRVLGGADPSGLKAVAPLGAETIVLQIPANVPEVSLLGERLEVVRMDRTEALVAPGRPMATISDVRVEYRPGRGRR
jgi:hypothetical protein